MKVINEQLLTGERALFKSKDLQINHSVFADGESPLKESKNIKIKDSIFRWKYPLWYCRNIDMHNSTLLETARSGIWYTDHIKITDSTIEAPKTFRKSKNISLINVNLPIALETLWNCDEVSLTDVTAKGDYFGMNSTNITINGFTLTGNYAFDGASNIEVNNAKIISKDAFWNCENVVVYNSVIIGEYLGWNSKNLTFINCLIESNQGLCYIDNLVIKNSKLINTDLAFEYSTVDVEVTTTIESVKNPISGRIQAKTIKELILDDPTLNLKQIEIIEEGGAKDAV